MAQLGLFNAADVPPAEPFSVLPANKYLAHAIQSEMRGTRDGNGQYLWIEFEILDGEYKGRKTWDRLNIVNANQQTVDIAYRTLSAICHATGTMNISDSEELHFKPVIIDVRVQPPKPPHDASNVIKGYLPPNAGTGAPAAATPTPAARPTASAQPPATYQAPGQRPPIAAQPAPRPAGGPSATPPWRRAAGATA